MPLSKENSVPMDEETSKMFLQACAMDMQGRTPVDMKTFIDMGIPENEVPFGTAAVLKRIDAMRLPISLTIGAAVLFSTFPDRIGGAILMLVDLLTAYEGKTIGVEDVVREYPYGFYSEDALIARLDAIKADSGLPEDQRKEKFGYVYAAL